MGGEWFYGGFETSKLPITLITIPCAPTVDFTQDPESGSRLPSGVYFNGTVVTFNATCTSPAYNNVTGQYGACTLWNWTFKHESNYTVEYPLAGSVQTFNFTMPGEWEVNLTGFAPVMLPEYPELAWSDPVTRTVTVLPCTSASIDLFTDNRRWPGYVTDETGMGLDQPADAYLGENVTLHALVTWNEDPLPNRSVWFDFYVNGEHLGFYWIQMVPPPYPPVTNETGVATMEFAPHRFYPGGLDPEGFLDEWLVVVKTEIAEGVWINDILQFDVGWIVELQNVTTIGYREGQWQPATEFGRGEYMKFNVTLRNIALTPRNAAITISVYDSDGIPINWTMVETTVPAGNFGHPYTMVIPITHVKIPEWAWLGLATVYANAYTASPLEEPDTYFWCPEISGSFEITQQDPPPPGPTANFTVFPEMPCVNETVTFNASASLPGFNGTHTMPIANYTWDFGDGNVTTITTPIITHKYATQGVYNVTLNLTDTQGLWNATSKSIPVYTLAIVNFTVTLPFGASAICPGRATHPLWGEWDWSTYPCWGAYPEKWRQIIINVTVENRGDEDENFTVTTYYDSHVVHDYYGNDTQNVTNLAPGKNVTLTFCWDTKDVPSCTIVYPQGPSKAGYYIPYSISVNISHPTLGDIKAEDGQVTARMVGDANCDGHCKGADFTILGMSWMLDYTSPYYDPRADLNGDGDVKGEDFTFLAMFWGEY